MGRVGTQDAGLAELLAGLSFFAGLAALAPLVRGGEGGGVAEGGGGGDVVRPPAQQLDRELEDRGVVRLPPLAELQQFGSELGEEGEAVPLRFVREGDEGGEVVLVLGLLAVDRKVRRLGIERSDERDLERGRRGGGVEEGGALVLPLEAIAEADAAVALQVMLRRLPLQREPSVVLGARVHPAQRDDHTAELVVVVDDAVVVVEERDAEVGVGVGDGQLERACGVVGPPRLERVVHPHGDRREPLEEHEGVRVGV